MKYIVDTQTGTIVSAEYCYIVDADDISEDLNPMSDRELSELAQNVGTRLTTIGQETGWGDNKYRYTVSYSPLSIKDESDSLLEGGMYDDGDKEYDALVWAKDEATLEQLASIADWAMAHDSVWNGFRENLTDAVMFAHKEYKKEEK
jgi:hypothetical protein